MAMTRNFYTDQTIDWFQLDMQRQQAYFANGHYMSEAEYRQWEQQEKMKAEHLNAQAAKTTPNHTADPSMNPVLLLTGEDA